ncbi:MAG: protein jag [Lachnospiraceae bacterium]|nr:protein jag [Lachnospiraceae bacterium]
MEFQIFNGKTVDDAITNALVALETTSDNIEYEVLEKGSNGFLGIGNKPAKIQARIKEKEVTSMSIEETCIEFLSKVFSAMDMIVKINVKVDEEEVKVDLIGDDMGVLIGKRGQTLDSLQYLLSLVINKNTENYLRVKLDTENYRERRKETLENLAKNIAFKVKRTKRPVTLEPMNPYERRIIHSALQNDRYVTTRSEGEEPFRHVVVVLKKNY